MDNILRDLHYYYGDYGCRRFLVWPLNSNPRRVRVHPISGLFQSLIGLSNGFAGEGIPESPTYHTTLRFSELLLYVDLI